MTPQDCPREQDVTAAILARRWPHGCDRELTVHAAACEVCGEVALVAGLLREDHEASRRDVHVPAAGQVWWRAALRARHEAAQAAGRPITWIHGLMGASAVGLSGAAVRLAWPSLQGATSWAGSRMPSVDPDTAAVAALLGDAVLRTLPYAIAIAAGLVLAPLALYFALSDD